MQEVKHLRQQLQELCDGAEGDRGAALAMLTHAEAALRDAQSANQRCALSFNRVLTIHTTALIPV